MTRFLDLVTERELMRTSRRTDKKTLTRFGCALIGALLMAPTAQASEASEEKVPRGAKWLASGAGNWHSGCNHYQNRARFLPRTGNIAFVTLLAEACSAAEHSLEHGTETEQVAAEWFLAKVVLLRDTIVEMNMERVYGKTKNPWARPMTADGKDNEAHTVQLRRVSEWGEFLIAHRMGLFSAYDAYLQSGTAFSMAFEN